MDIRQLKTLVHVAELGSFSRAAKRLRIAQPALSRHIRMLESELDASLFERNSRGVKLTDSGKMFLQHASTILRQLESARASVAQSSRTISGHVDFGMPQSAGVLLAVPLIERFRISYPQVSLRLVEGVGSIVHDWMVNAQLDVGVIYNPDGSSQLMTQPLWTEDLHVVGPPSMFRRGETISFAKAAAREFTLPAMGNGLRGLVESYARELNVTLKILIEADAQRIQKDLAQRGTACTILPRASVEEDIRIGKLSSARIVEPVIPRTLALALPSDRPVSRAGRRLGRMIAEIATELVDDASRPDLYQPESSGRDLTDLLGGE